MASDMQPSSEPQDNLTEPDYAILLAGNKDPGVPYYIPNIRHLISDSFRQHLIHSAGNFPEEIEEHCQRIRDKAWAIRAYPCIGLGMFLQPPLLPKHHAYPAVLERLKETGRMYLDVGAFLGIDMRFLFHDLGGGLEEARKLVANDIVSFWELGFEFFNDRTGPFAEGVRFVQADFMNDSADSPLQKFEGKCDVIEISQVLHQWTLEQQIHACMKLVNFSRVEPGSIILGNQVGMVKAKAGAISKTKIFIHNVETWKEMWRKVEEKTGTKWDVKAELWDWKDMGYDPKLTTFLGGDARLIFWSSSRVA